MKILRHIIALAISPVIAVAFVAPFGDFGFMGTLAALGCIATFFGIPVGVPFVVLSLLLHLKNPVWYLLGGGLVGVISELLLDLFGHSVFGLESPGAPSAPIFESLLLGVLGGAVYFVIGVWSRGRIEAGVVLPSDPA